MLLLADRAAGGGRSVRPSVFDVGAAKVVIAKYWSSSIS